MKTPTIALTALAVLVLTACGGGSDNNNTSASAPAPAPVANTPAPAAPTTGAATPTPTITASAEGVYEGNVAGGLTHLTLVTDTSRLFTVVGTTTGGVFAISRFLESPGSSNNGAFSATGVRAYGAGASAADGTFTATYVPGTSLNGTLLLDGVSTTVSGTALTNTSYDYNTPAKLANVACAWSLTGVDGARVTLAVGADGKFSGTSGTCAVTGSLTPRPSGKNVFTFSVVSGPAPCARPNEVMNGVAVEFSIGSVRQLMAAGSVETRANGIGWVGSR